MKIPTVNFLGLLKKTFNIFLTSLSVSIILIGGLGLFLAYINPIPWVAGYFPISLAGFYMTGEQAFQEIKTWQATPILSVAVSAAAIFSGLAL